MAEETAAPTIKTAEASVVTESVILPPEERTLNKPVEVPHEDEEVKESKVMAFVEQPSDTSEIDPSSSDHKRKLEDGNVEARETENEIETKVVDPGDAGDAGDAKRQCVDDGVVDGFGVDGSVHKGENQSLGSGQLPYTVNVESGTVDTVQKSTEDVTPPGTLPSSEQQETSRRIEIPNNKVGALIGKAGETIRLLQSNSGARIQITRDAEADSNSSSRPVELMGTLENINKAEQMIKDVIAEAVAGGSPALIARGFGAVQSGSEVYEMQVPNEKVGVIIGKGGETIKTLQTKSQARIQVIPQHLPEGDLSKERTVRITGNKKQIESAKLMIMDVMNQMPGKPSSLSAGHAQGYRLRGPSLVQSQMQQSTAYNYPQRGMYPSQTTQYPQLSYGNNYPQQPPPRNPSTGWEQRPAAPVQTPGGYDYYGQGQGIDMRTQPTTTASAPNYYGQSQTTSYGQPNQYPQSGLSQQSYGGHGYHEPNYNNQAPTQQMYSQQQQPVNSQPGFYLPQGSTTLQTAYTQQPTYSKPAAFTGAPQSYGPPSSQPVQSSYGSGGQPAYSQNYGPTSAYSQPSNQVAPNYVQGGQQAPAYVQPGAYSGGYGQYPPIQPAVYGEQQASNNTSNYGYQGGSAESGYANNIPPAVGTQTGSYVQAPANPASYDQSVVPQAGYGTAPVGYAKGMSPQPGAYGWQA